MVGYMQKRGWIRIVEAFFSLLLIAAALLIVINKGYLGGEDISAKVYDLQLAVLREIELDDNLRNEVLKINQNLIPIEDQLSNEAPNPIFENITKKINERMPDSFICRSKICDIDVICELEEYVEQDVYAQQVAITATLEEYSPRKLKLFCWSA